LSRVAVSYISRLDTFVVILTLFKKAFPAV